MRKKRNWRSRMLAVIISLLMLLLPVMASQAEEAEPDPAATLTAAVDEPSETTSSQEAAIEESVSEEQDLDIETEDQGTIPGENVTDDSLLEEAIEESRDNGLETDGRDASEGQPDEREKEDNEESGEMVLTETFEDSVSGEAYAGADQEEQLRGFLEVGPQEEPGMTLVMGPRFMASNFVGNRLTDINRQLYDALKALVIQVAKGETSSTILDITFEEAQLAGYRWTQSDLDGEELFEVNGDEKHINQAAAHEALNQICQVEDVVKSVIRDCPYEMFWFGNVYNVSRSYTPSVTINSSTESYMQLKSIRIRIKLKVSMDYQGDGEYVTNLAKIQSISGAMTTAQGIINEASGMGDLEKLEYFRQRICDLVSYNHNTTALGYGNPWQLIYVFDGDPSTNVVCEGYAKAFQYLCNESSFQAGDFACYSVSGSFQTGSDSQQGHMWNIVHLNGTNYLVDVTNCDGASPSTKLFMVKPVGGTVNDGYVFQAGPSQYTYRYYEDTRRIYSVDQLELLTHAWDSGTVIAAATCTSEGVIQYTCTDCGTTWTETIPATGHTMSAGKVTKAATCTEDGVRTYTCTSCGYARTERIPAAGHSMSAGQVTTDATCTTDGVKAYVCSNCGYTETERIPATGHTPVTSAAAVSPTLFREGKTEQVTCSVCGSILTPSQAVPMTELGRSLTAGCDGDDVRQVQQALLDLGYPVNVADGDFGSVTESAVYRFQRDQGIWVDGVVGAQTMSYLRQAVTVLENRRSLAASNTAGNNFSNLTTRLTRDLSYGSEGSDVNLVQQMLSSLGYGIVVDGYFGAQTQSVIIQFQRDHGLYVDGVVGNQTYSSLTSMIGAGVNASGSVSNIILTRSLSIGTEGEDVRNVQQKLSDLGYTIAVDGVFGVQTLAVVQSFQTLYGLYVDGVVGEQTLGALNR